jgi:hypothetical protein
MVKAGEAISLERLDGEDWIGELSGERYGILRFLLLDLGVSSCWTARLSTKLTVFRGV